MSRSIRNLLAWIAIASIPGALAGAPERTPTVTWELVDVGGLPGAEVRAILPARSGDVWIGTREHGLLRVDAGDVSVIAPGSGYGLRGVAALHEDIEGRRWVGGPGGFATFDRERWRTERRTGSILPRVVFGFHEQDDGALWLATSDGAARLRSGEWTVIGPEDGLPHPVVHAVTVDGEGTPWFACRAGLGRGSDRGIDVLFPELNIRSAVLDSSGLPWFGTSDGIRHWDGSRWVAELDGRTIVPLLVSASGELWAGSVSSGLYRRRDGAWQRVRLPAPLEGAEIFALAQAPDGTVWIGTAMGAARARRLD